MRLNHQGDKHYTDGLSEVKGAFSRAIFLWQRSIVAETLAKYLRSHTATKSLKEKLSKNLCLHILSHNLCCSVHTNDDKTAKIIRAKHICSCKLACVSMPMLLDLRVFVRSHIFHKC